MNKRFWMAFAACWVAGQALSFVAHGILMKPSYQALAHLWRPDEVMNSMMWIMFLSSALLVFVFCFIFTRNYEGKGIMEGVRYGVLIALLAAVPQAVQAFVVYPIPFTLSVKWAVIGLVYFTVLGAIMAAIYKPDAPAAA
ncbi:MAG: hypothetical protein ACRETF_03015 [Nevskiaceae bacterium]